MKIHILRCLHWLSSSISRHVIAEKCLKSHCSGL